MKTKADNSKSSGTATLSSTRFSNIYDVSTYTRSPPPRLHILTKFTRFTQNSMTTVRTIYFQGQKIDALIWNDTNLCSYRGVYIDQSCDSMFTMWLQDPTDQHCSVATRINGGLNVAVISQLLTLLGNMEMDQSQSHVVLAIRALQIYDEVRVSSYLGNPKTYPGKAPGISGDPWRFRVHYP
jgi:hypothetical protein